MILQKFIENHLPVSGLLDNSTVSSCEEAELILPRVQSKNSRLADCLILKVGDSMMKCDI